MRVFQWAVLPAFFWFVPASHAEPADPLALVPDSADLVVKIEQPRRLFESIYYSGTFKQLQGIEAIREFYDSTNFRRFTQLVAYFEKELGASYPEIIDQLAGGGIVYGLQFASEPPQLFVIQGRNEQMLRRFVDSACRIADQELVRQDAKDRLEKRKYRNLETLHVGKKFHAAAAGTALFISNKEEGLKKALDLSLDKRTKNLSRVTNVAEAHKLAGERAIAWMWLNLDKVHKAPQAKDIFRLPRDNAALTVLFGGILDVAARSSFLCAGLDIREDGFLLSVRMPRGREGMDETLRATVPPRGQAGSRPLLEPQGVLYSASFFLDLPAFWEKRAKLFKENQVKGLEEQDKNSAKFLAGSSVSKLLTQAGAYHRFVAVHQPKTGYKIVPGQKLPAFALITEVRDPDAFGKRMEAAIRGAALLATLQIRLKPADENYGGVKIVAYRFPEDAQFAPDADNLRFNFSPCFATVGNQIVASSTIELCHELIDLLKKESAQRSPEISSPFRERFYASGGAQYLNYYRDRLFTQTILDQAIPPEEAQQQVAALVDLVRQLGVLSVEDQYDDGAFHFDIRLERSGRISSVQRDKK